MYLLVVLLLLTQDEYAVTVVIDYFEYLYNKKEENENDNRYIQLMDKKKLFKISEIFANKYSLPCKSLRVSRYFTEPDYLMVIYRLYRGVDVRDAAIAHLMATEVELEGYEVFNISAASPFSRDDTHELLHDAQSVLLRHFPNIDRFFNKKGWQLPTSIDRVYCIDKAKEILNYHPKYNFDTLMAIRKIVS